jgi:hypothetical protein
MVNEALRVALTAHAEDLEALLGIRALSSVGRTLSTSRNGHSGAKRLPGSIRAFLEARRLLL